jgi:hypothetical protein
MVISGSRAVTGRRGHVPVRQSRFQRTHAVRGGIVHSQGRFLPRPLHPGPHLDAPGEATWQLTPSSVELRYAGGNIHA